MLSLLVIFLYQSLIELISDSMDISACPEDDEYQSLIELISDISIKEEIIDYEVVSISYRVNF